MKIQDIFEEGKFQYSVSSSIEKGPWPQNKFCRVESVVAEQVSQSTRYGHGAALQRSFVEHEHGPTTAQPTEQLPYNSSIVQTQQSGLSRAVLTRVDSTQQSLPSSSDIATTLNSSKAAPILVGLRSQSKLQQRSSTKQILQQKSNNFTEKVPHNSPYRPYMQNSSSRTYLKNGFHRPYPYSGSSTASFPEQLSQSVLPRAVLPKQSRRVAQVEQLPHNSFLKQPRAQKSSSHMSTLVEQDVGKLHGQKVWW